MKKQKTRESKIVVSFSKKEADYISGILGAYRSNLEINKNRGGDMISKEIQITDRIGRKFQFS